MTEFTGRRAIIMGGSRGIGRSIALGFTRAGAAVAICARGQDALETTRREIEALGAVAYAAPTDLANPQDIARFIPDAANALGGINILVNNASGFGARADEASWAASFDVDLMATVRASTAALPYLERAGEAAIVNITSISAMRATKRNPPYGAIKAAVIHYTGSQARTLAARGIRVNAVAPTYVETDLTRGLLADPVATGRILDATPMRRLATAEEVADAVLFLVGPGAAMTTGHTLPVDGGFLAV